jgi:subtilisin family serine protease
MTALARPPGQALRRCFVFRAVPWLREEGSALGAAYLAGERAALAAAMRAAMGLPETDAATGRPLFEVTQLPLRDWEIDLPADRPAQDAVRGARRPPVDAAIAIRFPSGAAERAFRANLCALGDCHPAVGDVPIASALHWCPTRGEGDAFGTLDDARRLMRAQALADAGLDGAGVNVVVVDQGVDRSRLPRDADFAGGWARRDAPAPGDAAPDNRHGTMVARCVLAAAPRARIWDCALIPPRIRANLGAFLSDAHGAVARMEEDIALLRAQDDTAYGGPWVFVNAWSIYDRRGEAAPGECTASHDHCATCALEEASLRADIVFAAGNCGTFCPDGRCADEVMGPGRSILGVNSLAGVLTVGAVRTDGLWAGFSSEGPGQFPGPDGQPQQKPDLAAPSHFAVPGTAHRRAGGTSAASGLAAGIVAALRTRGRGTAMPPPALFDLLRRSARQDGGAGWNGRTGHGVVDAAAALALLRRDGAA